MMIMRKGNIIRMIWNYNLEDIVRGYCEEAHNAVCVMCGKVFEKGRIYMEGEELYDACGAMRAHIGSAHEDTASFLLKQDISLLGISEVQRRLLTMLSENKTDKEIADTIGIAQSTVRNHRFKLREKEKQAKLFLALMNSMEMKTSNNIAKSDMGAIEELHSSATMIDARYSITEKEKEKTILTYMDENGALKQFPAKEKKKIILLREIMKNFKADSEYTEKEVNRILKRIYEEDYAGIRRALIEYGFMDRSADGTVYRVKG